MGSASFTLHPPSFLTVLASGSTVLIFKHFAVCFQVFCLKLSLAQQLLHFDQPVKWGLSVLTASTNCSLHDKQYGQTSEAQQGLGTGLTQFATPGHRLCSICHGYIYMYIIFPINLLGSGTLFFTNHLKRFCLTHY